MPRSGLTLTDKEQKFVKFFVELGGSGSGTEAVIRAGFSARTAGVTASKLMRKPKILKAIQSLMDKVEDRNAGRIALTKRRILEKLSDSLNRDLADFEDKKGWCISKMKDLPKRVMAFVDGFKVKQFFDENGDITHQTIEVRLSPSAAAQEMAMKFRGLFKPEKHEVAHSVQADGFDWQRLYSPPPQEDPIEAQILEVKALPSPSEALPPSNGNGKAKQ